MHADGTDHPDHAAQSPRRLPRVPLGARSPDDFSDDQHGRASPTPPGRASVRSFMMQSQTREPIRPAPRVERHARSEPAPAHPDALGEPWQRLPASVLSDDEGVDAPLSPATLVIKSKLIEQILLLNPTASHEFLQGFSPRQLRTYLDHLTIAREPRGITPIRRPSGTPAVEVYRPSA